MSERSRAAFARLLDQVSIRQATLADVEVIARHRAAMYRDMGVITPEAAARLIVATEAYLREATPRGEYVGWLASVDAATDAVVAGVGVQRRRTLPAPRRRPDGAVHITEGRQAIVVNVYTEPAFRRRGLSYRLMLELLGWARATGLESLVLHASPDGRALYERLGFSPTNEMRFSGDLSTWTAPEARDPE